MSVYLEPYFDLALCQAERVRDLYASPAIMMMMTMMIMTMTMIMTMSVIITMAVIIMTQMTLTI